MDPASITVDPETGKMRLVPTMAMFSYPKLEEVDLSNLHIKNNDAATLNFLTPEVAQKLMTKELAGNEAKFKKL